MLSGEYYAYISEYEIDRELEKIRNISPSSRKFVNSTFCRHTHTPGGCLNNALGKCNNAHSIEKLSPVSCDILECNSKDCLFIHKDETKTDYCERLKITNYVVKNRGMSECFLVIATSPKDASNKLKAALDEGRTNIRLAIV